MRDDQDKCDGSPVTAWDQGYRPGPPRIVPRARSPPNPRNTPAGFPVASNPGCCGLDRQRVHLVFQEEEACPAHVDLVGEKIKATAGTREMWDECGTWGVVEDDK